MALIFGIPEANTVMNILHKKVEEYIIENDLRIEVYDVFALSGKAAAILQTQATEPIQNIVFTVQDNDLLNYFQKNIHLFFRNKGVFLFQNRIIVNFEGFTIELWNLPGDIIYSAEFEMYVHDFNDIPKDFI